MTTRHAVWLLAVGFGLVAVAVVRSDPAFSPIGNSVAAVALLLAAGWSLFIAAFAVSATGRRSVAPMLVAAGITWFAAEMASPGAGSAPVFTFGLVLSLACPAFVGWAMLAHPTGALATVAERMVVAGLLLALVGSGGLVAALFYDSAAVGCTRCPANLLLLGGNTQVHTSLMRISLLVGAFACLAVIALGVVRIARATVAVRRAILGPTVWGSLYLSLTMVSLAKSSEQAFLGTGPFDRQVWLAQAAALVGVGSAFIWGRVQLARCRASLARLAVEVGESARSGTVRDGLARVLGDPSLTMAYPVGEGRLADENGVLVDGQHESLLTTPLVSQGRTVAVLGHHIPLSDVDAADDITPAVRLALDHERLRAEVNWRLRELQSSRRRVVEAMDSERRKLERDLHDGAQQRLIAISLELGLLCDSARETSLDVTETLIAARERMQGAINDLRELARGIHPVVLSDHGLAAALESLAETSQTTLIVTSVPLERFPDVVEGMAYRIVAEAAKSGPVTVSIGRHSDRLLVEVETNITPDAVVELDDRVGALGGRFEVDSSRTLWRISAEIPCA